MAAPTSAPSPAWVRVIVQAAGGANGAAEAALAVGARGVVPLPIVDGVSAEIPAGAEGQLRSARGVFGVTRDRTVRVASSSTTTPETTINSVYAREVNADRLWARGIKGDGAVVALVDTGVDDSVVTAGEIGIVKVDDPWDRNPGGLREREQVDCVDLSGESSCDDNYGHGTFLAGIIAGRGTLSNGTYTGVAPHARILSVKIAGRSGAADVTKVLAAIQWVVSFKGRYGIDVLNLSLGTDSTRDYRHDPLNYAVERAWDAGLFVSVAASNRGPGLSTISKPGDDPLVVTVGATDDRETPAVDDDRVPSFSGRGIRGAKPTKPDVVAPGAYLVSLRAPGSYIDERVPPNPTSGLDPDYRRGTGTSMSTAVVSGVAALLSQSRAWNPDQLKFALLRTARPVQDTAPHIAGAGLIDALAADAVASPPADWQRAVERSDGSGPLGESRGTTLVQGCSRIEQLMGMTECVIEGDETSAGSEWDLANYQGDWNGNSWYESQWVGLTGNSWYGNSWYGNSWYGNSWYEVGSSGADDRTAIYGEGIEGSAWYGVWRG